MSVHLKYPNLRNRRILALLVSGILVLVLLLSAAFVLVERHHDCTGAHCEICAAVIQTVAFLKAESSVFLTVVTTLSVLFSAFAVSAGLHPANLPKASPVSLKVKLSD